MQYLLNVEYEKIGFEIYNYVTLRIQLENNSELSF